MSHDTAPQPNGARIDAAIAATDRRRWVCEEIVHDAKADVERFEGQPFNGRTVAEYMGCQAAAIAALARVVATLLPDAPSPVEQPTDQYPSPAAIADVEAECVRVENDLALGDVESVRAQCDLWEDHARIAHKHLDELRAAVENIADNMERLAVDPSSHLHGAAGALRRALAGAS